MAGMKRLVPTNQLKTGLLTKLAHDKSLPLFVHYDNGFDALILQLVPPGTETVVHYVDEFVALLYRAEDNEIVGLQVEDFEYGFLPKHAGVQRVWRLSESTRALESFGDMVLAVERLKPQIAREVAEATKDVLGEQGAELVALLAA